MFFQSKRYRMIRWSMICSFVFVCCFFFSTVSAFAITSTSVVSSRIADKDLLLYVSGVDSSDVDASLIIGNTAIDSSEITITSMVDAEYPIHTVLLLDNSISLKKIWEKNAKKLMTEIIDGHAKNEMFMIATYAEGLSVVSDFSNNYEGLKTTINGISYVNQSSYLTDILYEMVDSFKNAGEPYFVRIVVICDGSDDNEISYTNAELTKLLNESGIPVNTIGAADKSNSKALELLFSYSRASGGQSLKVTNKDDTTEAKDMLADDYNLKCIRVGLPWSLKDGSTKAAQLTIKSGGEEHVITTNLTMPFDVMKEYTVSFSDENGEKVLESVTLKEGEIPVFEGDAPLKNDDDNHTYKFIGWSNGTTTYVVGESLPPVSEDITFKAVFLTEEKANFANDLVAEPTVPVVPKKTVPWFVWLIGAAIMAVIIAIVLIIIMFRSRDREPVFHELEPINDEAKSASREMSEPNLSGNLNTNGKSGRRGNTQMLRTEPDQQKNSQQSGEKTAKLTLENCNNPSDCYSCDFMGSAVIGWNDDNDISLSFDDAVSGEHCKIEKYGNSYYISDLNSSNHTYYYGKKDYNNPKNRIEVKSDIAISNEDVVEIGREKYRIKFEEKHLTRYLYPKQ